MQAAQTKPDWLSPAPTESATSVHVSHCRMLPCPAHTLACPRDAAASTLGALRLTVPSLQPEAAALAETSTLLESPASAALASLCAAVLLDSELGLWRLPPRRALAAAWQTGALLLACA